MSHTQLNLKQRFQLETLLGAGWLQKNIAHHIDVNPSTISRELSLFGSGTYDARSAHSQSAKRRKVGKRKRPPDSLLGQILALVSLKFMTPPRRTR